MVRPRLGSWRCLRPWRRHGPDPAAARALAASACRYVARLAVVGGSTGVAPTREARTENGAPRHLRARLPVRDAVALQGRAPFHQASGDIPHSGPKGPRPLGLTKP